MMNLEKLATETAQQYIVRLQTMVKEEAAKAAAAKAATQGKLTVKVSEKGAASVYGLGRMPVTLYKGQWTRLIDFIPTLSAFLEANAEVLADKTRDQQQTIN